MRPGPPIRGLIVLLVGTCATQALRLTDGGVPVADAITAILLVVAASMGVPLLIFVLLGARNRKLGARLLDAGNGADGTFAIFFSKELRDALRPFSSFDGGQFDRHGVMHVSESGVALWSARKDGPVIPELVASIPVGDITEVNEAWIPIEGGEFWGLTLEASRPGGEVVELPIGLANRRLAAFFPSRREVRRSHVEILVLISPRAAHA